MIQEAPPNKRPNDHDSPGRFIGKVALTYVACTAAMVWTGSRGSKPGWLVEAALATHYILKAALFALLLLRAKQMGHRLWLVFVVVGFGLATASQYEPMLLLLLVVVLIVATLVGRRQLGSVGVS